MNDTLPDAVFSTPTGRVVLHGEFTGRKDRRERDEPGRPSRKPRDERFPGFRRGDAEDVDEKP